MSKSRQATGGSVKSSPGDKIKSAHVPKGTPHRLDSMGGTHRRGRANGPKGGA